MPVASSEIERAETIVAAVTEILDVAHALDRDEIVLHVYADDAACRLAYPAATRIDNAEHNRIVRTAARAAHRHGFDLVVQYLSEAAMRAWIARQGQDAEASRDFDGAGEKLQGDAALRALGLRAADLKEAPRKPATGRTLAARIARWATDPEADEDLIIELTEELLSQRLDGALGIVESMLEPEDYAYARHAIDFLASTHPIGEAGKEQQAVLFICPVMRSGDDPREPAVPPALQGALADIARDQAFKALILAPYWIATSTVARLRPTELQEAAEALANGLEPPFSRASPLDRDVCLFGLAVPMEPADEEEDELAARINSWDAVVADAAGGGTVGSPMTLARALDLLRRVKLAIPDEPLEDADDEPGETTVSEGLLAALAAHLATIGTGSALITGAEDGVLACSITDGAVDMPPEVLREVLAEALLDGGTLFVVPAAAAGRQATGHAFVLENGEAENVSAADAAALFADEAPADWAAAPSAWSDAPALEYDPDA